MAGTPLNFHYSIIPTFQDPVSEKEARTSIHSRFAFFQGSILDKFEVRYNFHL